MHIPIRVDYGVRALVDLAEHGGDGAVRSADVARRKAIPEPYLVQLLHTLRKGGLVRSQRGPQGGHSLAIDPADIRLSMVMECLEGAEAVVRCLEDAASCIHVSCCAQRDVWRAVQEAIYGILDSTSIADLVKRTAEIQAGRPAPLEMAAGRQSRG
jgi:Rrf2 family protein